MRTTICAGLLLVALTACGGGGGGGGGGDGSSSAKDTPSPESSTPPTYGDPVQLSVDPCSLVTQPEAEEVIGLPVSVGRSASICTYTATGNGGHIAIEDLAPMFCSLLTETLRQDRFGGDQIRVDDVGDGGMLVKGLGNVQFVVQGGCVSIDAVHGDTRPTDDIMLDLAKTAAGRVTG
jgi:hypothetical protein